MDDFEKELKQGFLEEAAQSLADAEQCFLNLERASEDPAILEMIFRLAHNLKGSARAVGFDEMGQFTHQLESLLLRLKKKELSINSKVVTLLLHCNDHLVLMINALKSDLTAKVDGTELLSQIEIYLSITENAADETHNIVETGSVVETPSNVEAPEDIVPENKEELLAIPSAEAFNLSAAELSPAPAAPTPVEAKSPEPTREPTVELGEKITEASVAPVKGKAPAAPVQAPQDESIRVSLSKLEQLINNVGEMVILQTMLSQQSHTTTPLMQRTIVQLSKISKNIQEISMGLRMLPVKQTFQKMQRIVRDTSKALDKEIDLLLEGEETELDKTVLDLLGDPLVHLIRNAVDHGIEDRAQRLASGKDSKAKISLKAFHRGGSIVIELQDDGRGLDAQRIQQKAEEKGLIPKGQNLKKEEAYNLIFLPGFSTKAEVTDLSGRGVGLDVVKTNIERLQGQVQIETELGKGSCFRIILPLTLAIIDGLLIQSEERAYVIPLSQMHESMKLQPKDVYMNNGVGEVMNLRGEVLPLYRIEKLLTGKIISRPATDGTAVVVRGAQHEPFAVLVDEIIRQQQVVIKSLGGELTGLRGISGAAILGDGKASLILDLVDLAIKPKKPTSTSLAIGAA